jgi:hypothetical protein
MRTREVILVLRRPDRRSATMVSVVLRWGVDLFLPIMHQRGGKSPLPYTDAGTYQFGTDYVSYPNCDILITIPCNSWINYTYLGLNYHQRWFNCCNYLYYWMNHDWTVTEIGTDRKSGVNRCVSNQLRRFLWSIWHITHLLCNVHQSKQSAWSIVIFRCIIVVLARVPAMNFKNLDQLLDSKLNS